MERLKQILSEFKGRNPLVTEQDLLNTAREYLQVLVLKLIYQSKQGPALSFMGGTSLRICYDLKRYSEDLDFALDDPKTAYRFAELIQHLKRELDLLGYPVSSKAQEDKIVQKAYLSFADFAEQLGLRSFRKEQKLHIKIEVDVRPVPLKKDERESFFVNRFQEIFPILKHTLPTLFAGKILAILHRPYRRGRDYYDLIWYLARKTELNRDYLNRGMKERKFENDAEVFKTLQEKVHEVQPSLILKDIDRFLEDPREEDWIKRYSEVFDQLIRERGNPG